MFSTGAWVSAALVLRSKNPVHSVFYLVLTFLHASGLLLMLGLEFFALLQLLVYIGALAIMFLFVVMLLDIPATEILAHQRGTYPVAGLLFLTLVLAVGGVLWQPIEKSPFMTPYTETITELSKSAVSESGGWEIPWQTAAGSHSALAGLGVALYGVHVDLLILASLVLLVAMMGAVALTLKRRVHAPLHDVFVQHSVDFQKVVSKIVESSLILERKILSTENSLRKILFIFCFFNFPVLWQLLLALYAEACGDSPYCLWCKIT
jgi:NADH-quinone oxidoreductase subunit J